MCLKSVSVSISSPVANPAAADELLVRQADDAPFEVRLSDESFETYELDPPPYTLHTTKKELKQMYYDMVAVRYAASSFN